MTKKRRRLEGKTDYKARIGLLKFEGGRIIFRKTNKYIIGQYVESSEAQDKVIIGLASKKLLDYGWPENISGSLKSLPASYFTGFVLGKKMLDKEKKEGILDIGLLRNIKKSRIYAFLKGLIDAGVKINVKEENFPDENRIVGRHLKKGIEFNKIKSEIEKKFA